MENSNGAAREHTGPPAPPGAAQLEVELKLLLDPANLPRLRRQPILRDLGTTRASSRVLDSVYFDTPNRALLREGLTLRVRRAGRSRVQTLKARTGTSGPLFRRTEIESRIAGDLPEPSLIGDLGYRALVERCIGDGPLQPIVETVFRRWTRRLRTGETELLFAVDLGEIRTQRGSLPLCEIELELVRGDPRLVYDVALELAANLPLCIGVESKFDRGLALLTGERPTPQRAGRVKLEKGATIEVCLQTIFQSCVDQIVANQEPAQQGVDPEGVHQMRVGARRLRSALGLFGDVLSAEHTAQLREELRWLGRELGDARDLDVFLGDTLAPLVRRLPDNPGLKRLRDAAAELREDAYARAREAIYSPRYTALILGLGRWMTARSWREQPLNPESAQLFLPARDHGATLLSKRRRKVRRLGRHIRERSTEEKHALRIQLKKLRYAAEFLRSLCPERGARRYIRRAANLQDTLGHLNDVATGDRIVCALLERLGEEATVEHQRACGFVLGWIAHGARDRLEGIAAQWKALDKTRPFWLEER